MAFITSLRIKNFFSIKDEVTIDFKASPYNIENNPKRLFEFNGEYYNKVISFYGANASGKTTVLKAITTLAKIIHNEDSKHMLTSFKNKFISVNVSSELSITFVVNIDNTLRKFLYEVEFESNKYENIGISDEKLFEVYKNKRVVLLNRKEKNIKNIDDNIINGVFNNLSNKKSLIQEFYKFEQTKILENVKNSFYFIYAFCNINDFSTQLTLNEDDKKNFASWLDPSLTLTKVIENFFVSFFHSLGQDIVEVKVKFKEEDGKEREFIGIDVVHQINTDEPLEFELESDGTQMLLKVLHNIFMANLVHSPLIIDELDSLIHPMLVPIIINLLIENDIQIIYSTHNIYNMQFLQNDEIFLIEKDSNHKTTIKAVKDNTDIKGYKNLLTLYENGYLGGLPNIKEILTKIL